MKQTYKNRKYKKRTNKRRKSVKNNKKNSKKIKGGDSVDIVAYESLIHGPTDPSDPTKTLPLFNYKIISKRDFPKTIVDTIIYQPWRDVEESIAEINKSMELSESDFEEYPQPQEKTTIEISYPHHRLRLPIITPPSSSRPPLSPTPSISSISSSSSPP